MNILFFSFLHPDSCAGGVKQIFSDTACITFVSAEALNPPQGCVKSGPNASVRNVCTTSTDPVLYAYSTVAM